MGLKNKANYCSYATEVQRVVIETDRQVDNRLISGYLWSIRRVHSAVSMASTMDVKLRVCCAG